MKKIYTLITAFAVIFSANAQRSVNMNDVHERNGFTPKVIPTINNTRAQGDTLMYFDGNYISGLGIDATFNVQDEDIDGKTIYTGLQASFGTTSGFNFFYTTATPTGDTNFFMGATSYFSPVGQADNWLEMGPITIPASGATLSWKHNMQDKNYRDGYKVKVTTGGITFDNFTDPALFSVGDNASSTLADTARTPYRIFYPRSVDLSSYAGQDIYVAINHDAVDMFIIWFDDILITEGTMIGVKNDFVNGFKVSQNSPNPFNSLSTINYQLENNANVSLAVYDVTGKKIAEQSEGQQSAGSHVLKFNGQDLSAGVYYYSLKVGENTSSAMKMVVVK
jgi:hypothetical protein